MGLLEGYSGDTTTTAADWKACATKCSTTSSCKAWQFFNSECMLVESYQRTKAVEGKGSLLIQKQMNFSVRNIC